MGRPKWSLRYGGVSQLERALQLLRPFCDEVFISCQQGQELPAEFDPWPKIEDSVPADGPLAGILSAIRREPSAAWLVLACDLPGLEQATLRALIVARNGRAMATAFRSPADGLPEPLCAIYEPSIATALESGLRTGVFSPRKLFTELEVILLDPVQPGWLTNVNSSAEYESATRTLMR